MNLRPRFAIEAVEILQQKSLGRMAGASGTKIEKENGVAIANALFVWMRENERRHEFIRDPAFVVRPHGRRRTCFTALAAAEHNRIPRFLCSIPSPVAIHREITADNCGYLRARFF